MVDLGLRAGLSFTIGMGILPIIGGLASLRPQGAAGRARLPRVRRLRGGGDPLRLALHRGQGGLPLDRLLDPLGGAEPDLPLAAHARRDGARLRVEEARLALRRRRGGFRARAGRGSSRSSSATRTSRRPGFAIAALANRELHWDVDDLRLGSVVALGVSLLLIALRRRRWRGALGRSARARVDADVRDHDDGRRRPLRQQIPRPPAKAPRLGRPRHARQAGHLPRAGDRGPERTLADRVLEPLDQARRQPRRLARPARVPAGRRSSSTPTGTLSGYADVPYVLADNGVVLQAPIVQSQNQGTLKLYRKRSTGPGGCSTPSSRSTPTAGAPTGAPTPTSSRTSAARSSSTSAGRGSSARRRRRAVCGSRSAPSGSPTGRRRCSSTSTGARW